MQIMTIRINKSLKKLLVGNKLRFFSGGDDLESSTPMLSHFSHKRKEYNVDRFEKIFDKFDLEMDPFKEHKFDKYRKMCKYINKSYVGNEDINKVDGLIKNERKINDL